MMILSADPVCCSVVAHGILVILSQRPLQSIPRLIPPIRDSIADQFDMHQSKATSLSQMQGANLWIFYGKSYYGTLREILWLRHSQKVSMRDPIQVR